MPNTFRLLAPSARAGTPLPQPVSSAAWARIASGATPSRCAARRACGHTSREAHGGGRRRRHARVPAELADEEVGEADAAPARHLDRELPVEHLAVHPEALVAAEERVAERGVARALEDRVDEQRLELT